MSKIYVVTGAFGHLGNTIVKKLYENGEKIRCFDLKKDHSKALSEIDVEIVYGDTRDPESLDALFSNLTDYEIIVIHTAAIISITSRFNKNMYDVNVRGTKNMIQKCKQYNVKKLIYVSSVHAIPV